MHYKFRTDIEIEELSCVTSAKRVCDTVYQHVLVVEEQT